MSWIGGAEIFARHGPLDDSDPGLVKDYACGLPVKPKIDEPSRVLRYLAHGMWP